MKIFILIRKNTPNPSDLSRHKLPVVDMILSLEKLLYLGELFSFTVVFELWGCGWEE